MAFALRDVTSFPRKAVYNRPRAINSPTGGHLTRILLARERAQQYLDQHEMLFGFIDAKSSH